MRGSATDRMRQSTMTSATHPRRKTRSDARPGGHIEKARELRRASTEAEEAAWFLLRRLPLKGFEFRRQRPVGMNTAGNLRGVERV